MALLVRKVEMSKWRQNDILNGADVSADAITNCLRTTNNKISVWMIDDEENIEDAVLAIVSHSEHLDSIDIVKIGLETVSDRKLKLTNSPGLTPYSAYIGNHYDIEELSYRSLGTLASILVQCFIDGNDMRFTRGKLKSLLVNGIGSGKINKEDLNTRLLNKLFAD